MNSQTQIPDNKSGESKNIYAVLGGTILLLVIVVVYLLINGYAGKKIEVKNNPNSQPVNTTSPSSQDQVNGMEQETALETYVSASWFPKWIPSTEILKEDPTIPKEDYKVGKIESGKYKDKDLYLRVEPGLGTSYSHFVLSLEGTPVFFDKENIKIRGIDDIPEEIDLPGTSYKLKKNWVANDPFNKLKIESKAFTHPVLGDVYLTDLGCFVVELPNHTAVSYDFILPFVNKESRQIKVQFNDNSENKDSYTYTRIQGCVAICFYLAQMKEEDLNPPVRLIELGKTGNGEPLYGLKDPNDKALLDLYSDTNTVAYMSDKYEPQPKSKYTYSEFLVHKPFLYWKDPIGRWIEFKNDRFQIAAEMCKPVIYLYPEKDMEVSVKVNPNGGFTYSSPPYGFGWRVKANPDGVLTDLNSGKIYNYLFWEGIGLNYPKQESGFVVKQGELNLFLSEKLKALGLNAKESTDFKAYWVPRLLGINKAYYKISFLKKEQFDELAPLEIGPTKPSSVIRVMMTATGLDVYEPILEQELPLPAERLGFTLVEWGGTVLK